MALVSGEEGLSLRDLIARWRLRADQCRAQAHFLGRTLGGRMELAQAKVIEEMLEDLRKVSRLQ